MLRSKFLKSVLKVYYKKKFSKLRNEKINAGKIIKLYSFILTSLKIEYTKMKLMKQQTHKNILT